MNINTTVQTGLCLALIANITACVDPDASFGEEAEVLSEETLGATEQAIGTCAYAMAGAAITKQIVSIGQPTQILVELVTVTDKPYKMNVTSMTFPAGFNSVSLATTTCSDSGTRWKCRHQGVIENTWATSGTGAYSMALTPVADSGSGCGNGASQRIDFWLTTESFAAYEITP
jgi:hypothetical protein